MAKTKTYTAWDKGKERSLSKRGWCRELEMNEAAIDKNIYERKKTMQQIVDMVRGRKQRDTEGRLVDGLPRPDIWKQFVFGRAA